MGEVSTDWTLEFYSDHRGREPALEYIENQTTTDQAHIAHYMALLQDLGVRISEPYAKHVAGKLWELRPQPHRLIYFMFTGRRIVILHAFRKTSNKTRRRDIDIARKRMHDFIDREERTK